MSLYRQISNLWAHKEGNPHNKGVHISDNWTVTFHIDYLWTWLWTLISSNHELSPRAPICIPSPLPKQLPRERFLPGVLHFGNGSKGHKKSLVQGISASLSLEFDILAIYKTLESNLWTKLDNYKNMIVFGRVLWLGLIWRPQTEGFYFTLDIWSF